jgi:NTE family protein
MRHVRCSVSTEPSDDIGVSIIPNLDPNQATQPRRRRLGLALGSGAALGLAHIGVIKGLEKRGIVPDVVCGTSIGAIVGAAYVFGVLDRLEGAVRKVGWREVLRLADFRFNKGGFLNGKSIVREVQGYIGEATFEDAERPFAVMASDLARNEAVTLSSGRVVDALRASISLPGVFTPVQMDGRVLVDGGIKNPVPVSTCRALGAETVIAVDVTGDYAGQAEAAGMVPGARFKGGLYEIASLSVAMIMSQIAQANYIAYPADLRIVPKIGHVRPFGFHEGELLIEAGYQAIEAMAGELESLT